MPGKRKVDDHPNRFIILSELTTRLEADGRCDDVDWLFQFEQRVVSAQFELIKLIVKWLEKIPLQQLAHIMLKAESIKETYHVVYEDAREGQYVLNEHTIQNISNAYDGFVLLLQKSKCKIVEIMVNAEEFSESDRLQLMVLIFNYYALVRPNAAQNEFLIPWNEAVAKLPVKLRSNFLTCVVEKSEVDDVINAISADKWQAYVGDINLPINPETENFNFNPVSYTPAERSSVEKSKRKGDKRRVLILENQRVSIIRRTHGWAGWLLVPLASNITMQDRFDLVQQSNCVLLMGLYQATEVKRHPHLLINWLDNTNLNIGLVGAMVGKSISSWKVDGSHPLAKLKSANFIWPSFLLNYLSSVVDDSCEVPIEPRAGFNLWLQDGVPEGLPNRHKMYRIIDKFPPLLPFIGNRLMVQWMYADDISNTGMVKQATKRSRHALLLGRATVGFLRKMPGDPHRLGYWHQCFRGSLLPQSSADADYQLMSIFVNSHRRTIALALLGKLEGDQNLWRSWYAQASPALKKKFREKAKGYLSEWRVQSLPEPLSSMPQGDFGSDVNDQYREALLEEGTAYIHKKYLRSVAIQLGRWQEWVLAQPEDEDERRVCILKASNGALCVATSIDDWSEWVLKVSSISRLTRERKLKYICASSASVMEQVDDAQWRNWCWNDAARGGIGDKRLLKRYFKRWELLLTTRSPKVICSIPWGSIITDMHAVVGNLSEATLRAEQLQRQQLRDTQQQIKAKIKELLCCVLRAKKNAQYNVAELISQRFFCIYLDLRDKGIQKLILAAGCTGIADQFDDYGWASDLGDLATHIMSGNPNALNELRSRGIYVAQLFHSCQDPEERNKFLATLARYPRRAAVSMLPKEIWREYLLNNQEMIPRFVGHSLITKDDSFCFSFEEWMRWANGIEPFATDGERLTAVDKDKRLAYLFKCSVRIVINYIYDKRSGTIQQVSQHRAAIWWASWLMCRNNFASVKSYLLERQRSDDDSPARGEGYIVAGRYKSIVSNLTPDYKRRVVALIRDKAGMEASSAAARRAGSFGGAPRLRQQRRNGSASRVHNRQRHHSHGGAPLLRR